MSKPLGRLASIHRNGPGLKQLGNARSERWYGPGYCGFCGTKEVVPVAVRYWDPDDGWRMGVLCAGCGEDCTDRGPQPDDFACRTQDDNADHESRAHFQAMRIDRLATLTDLDGAYADQMDQVMDDYANGDI